MEKGRILAADDEKSLTVSLKNVLTDAGYNIAVCSNRDEFFAQLASFNPDVVLLDIYLGTANGIQILKQVKFEGWRVPVIMMTAHSDVSLAVQAMKEGAADFVVKPFDLNHLIVLIEKNLEFAHLETRVTMLQEELEKQRSRSGIIGNSLALRRVLEISEKLASGESTTVLIEGESGTGKELMARFIHQKSVRNGQPFIALNCAAIPKDLAESEFFGYEKGAFTGATERMRQGKFEMANGGTILLDEIGELSLDMQVKLLRVLEERRFYRLGGAREISVDVRIIAASNKSLAKLVESGKFREDLFYRLNVAVVKIPPLRERREDIEALTYAFVQEFSRKFNKSTPQVEPEAKEFLERLPWKGNVRELRNAIERVVLLNDSQALTKNSLTFLGDGAAPEMSVQGLKEGEFLLRVPPKGVGMVDVLKDLILQTLEITQGNQVQAAKVLGITRSKLRYKMDQLKIKSGQRVYSVKGVEA
ncbi:MAG TPA: sigma-54 dependent transcriptional regulator [Bacteroidota bacterium]|nr:sigma-54 dependent transcriptional regulator [Bacteroidota bacterium]